MRITIQLPTGLETLISPVCMRVTSGLHLGAEWRGGLPEGIWLRSHGHHDGFSLQAQGLHGPKWTFETWVTGENVPSSTPRPCCNVIFWSCVLSLLLVCSVHTLYSHPVSPVALIHRKKMELFLSLLACWHFSTPGMKALFLNVQMKCKCAKEDALTRPDVIDNYQKVYNHLIWFIDLLMILTEYVCNNAPMQWDIPLWDCCLLQPTSTETRPQLHRHSSEAALQNHFYRLCAVYIGRHFSITEKNILHKITSVLFKFSLLCWHPINHFGNVCQVFLAVLLPLFLCQFKDNNAYLVMNVVLIECNVWFCCRKFFYLFNIFFCKIYVTLSPTWYLIYKILAQWLLVFTEGDAIISWSLIIILFFMLHV